MKINRDRIRKLFNAFQALVRKEKNNNIIIIGCKIYLLISLLMGFIDAIKPYKVSLNEKAIETTQLLEAYGYTTVETKEIYLSRESYDTVQTMVFSDIDYVVLAIPEFQFDDINFSIVQDTGQLIINRKKTSDCFITQAEFTICENKEVKFSINNTDSWLPYSKVLFIIAYKKKDPAKLIPSA